MGDANNCGASNLCIPDQRLEFARTGGLGDIAKVYAQRVAEGVMSMKDFIIQTESVIVPFLEEGVDRFERSQETVRSGPHTRERTSIFNRFSRR